MWVWNLIYKLGRSLAARCRGHGAAICSPRDPQLSWDKDLVVSIISLTHAFRHVHCVPCRPATIPTLSSEAGASAGRGRSNCISVRSLALRQEMSVQGSREQVERAPDPAPGSRKASPGTSEGLKRMNPGGVFEVEEKHAGEWGRA